MRVRDLKAAVLLIACTVFAATPTSVAAAVTPSNLEAGFARFAAQTDGQVGVAVQRVGGKTIASLNRGTTFPMASTFKIAVAGTILSRIDKGELTLDRMVTVSPAVIVASEGIAETLPHAGIALSMHNLLELMLTRSDNTATDVLVAQAGGPAAVTAWLRGIGITGQRVDADTARLIYRALGLAKPGNGTFAENIEAAFKAEPAMRERDTKGIFLKSFNDDPRDSSTPEAMVALLQVIRAGKALSPAGTRTLIEVMERCHTGEKRLKGQLPVGTVVAHKTGTLMGTANDVGLVTLPDGDQFAIAVFIKGDSKGIDVEERVIANISRLAYDYYSLGGE